MAMNKDTPERDRCSLTLPNDMGYVSVARCFVRQVAGHLGFTDDDRHRFELVVEEAATNVIKHAYEPGEVASFDIVCRRVDHGMEVCVHDRGIPWDPALDEEYDPAADLETQSGRGFGEHLIKHLVDEFAFDNLGHDGKQVRLVKYLDTSHISEEREGTRTPEVVAPPQSNPEPVELEIRRMRSEEAIEVSRAVFDCYGYSYAGEFVYYPERIAAMNRSGQLLSAVAVNRDTGEIAGHNALLFSDMLPAELAIAVTKHRYRGMGVARRLGEFLTDQAREKGLKGLYVKEVTAHPYTQKFCGKLGFSDCGLLLAHSPKSLVFKGIADDADQRNSDLLGFKPIRDSAPRMLYLPERHAAVIEKIYAGLPFPMRWRHSAAVPDSGAKTVMKVKVNSARSLCEIHISRYGADVIRALKQELRRLRSHEIQLAEAYLGLSDPCAPWVVTEIEKLGFFFTGILPETGLGDAIILQYFNGIDVEYDELVIERKETAMLLDYVKGQDPTMV